MTHTEVIHLYGTFMIGWSVLESMIETAIMKQLGLDAQRAIIVTSSMQFKARVSVLSSLLELHGNTYSEAISLLKKIEKDAKRNMLVHGHIVVGVPGQLTFVKSNIVDGYRANRTTFTASALRSHIFRLTEKTNRLQALLSVTDSDLQAFADVGINASA